jgi:hypothetical protein
MAAQLALSIWVIIMFWRAPMRAVFNGGVSPKKLTARQVLLTIVLPVIFALGTLSAPGLTRGLSTFFRWVPAMGTGIFIM